MNFISDDQSNATKPTVSFLQTMTKRIVSLLFLKASFFQP
jgi:hypothetical protein